MNTFNFNHHSDKYALVVSVLFDSGKEMKYDAIYIRVNNEDVLLKEDGSLEILRDLNFKFSVEPLRLSNIYIECYLTHSSSTIWEKESKSTSINESNMSQQDDYYVVTLHKNTLYKGTFKRFGLKRLYPKDPSNLNNLRRNEVYYNGKVYKVYNEGGYHTYMKAVDPNCCEEPWCQCEDCCPYGHGC